MANIFKKYDEAYQNLLFSYKGNPNDEKIYLILDSAEQKLILNEKNRTLQKRIVNILIEVLQNVFEHRDKFVIFDYEAFAFYLLKYTDHYCIVSGNYIRNEEVEDLKEKIDNCFSLSEIELKANYRDILRNGSMNKRGGAGLGLMDIMRKSEGDLEYKVIPVDDTSSFFLIEINISTY